MKWQMSKCFEIIEDKCLDWKCHWHHTSLCWHMLYLVYFATCRTSSSYKPLAYVVLCKSWVLQNGSGLPFWSAVLVYPTTVNSSFHIHCWLLQSDWGFSNGRDSAPSTIANTGASWYVFFEWRSFKFLKPMLYHMGKVTWIPRSCMLVLPVWYIFLALLTFFRVLRLPSPRTVQRPGWGPEVWPVQLGLYTESFSEACLISSPPHIVRSRCQQFICSS